MDTADAVVWSERWDAQQSRYAPVRTERDRIVAALVQEAIDGIGAPTVVDIGCGPGSLARHLAATLPAVDVVGIDADPLLVALAQAVGGGPRFVQGRAGSAGWWEAAGLRPTVEVIVSSAVVHYVASHDLEHWYADLLARLRPGGLLVTADRFLADDPCHRRLEEVVTSATRLQAPASTDTWAQWWEAADGDAGLRRLLSGQGDGGAEGRVSVAPVFSGDHTCDRRTHERALLRAGARSVGTVWQVGDRAIQVAAR
jgi:SAM-dependent methyltransferase